MALNVSLREVVLDVVRRLPGAPLSIDDVLGQVVGERGSGLLLVRGSNPKRSIRNALSLQDLIGSLGDGRYVYVPRAISGAGFWIPLDRLSSDGRTLAVDLEVQACILAAGDPPVQRERTIQLEPLGGKTVAVRCEAVSPRFERAAVLRLPAGLRSWLAAQRAAGCDGLVLRCRNGEKADFTLAGEHRAESDPAALAASDERLLDVAREICVRSKKVDQNDFIQRLLIRGAFHGDPPPDSLLKILMERDGRFIFQGGGLTYRPDLTPALRRLFAERIKLQQLDDPLAMDGLLARLARTLSPRFEAYDQTDEDDEEVEDEAEDDARGDVVAPPAQHLYRLKVRLAWQRSVWRTIAMLDNQTLEDLHDAIQDAFGWNRDHLYCFYLSGKRGDTLTEVSCPPWMAEEEPPYTTEVSLADFEPRPGQKFLYLFDFGDDLLHEIEVLAMGPVPATSDFPRVSESHGEAPPQYPEWDEDEDEEDGEEEE